MTFSRLNIALKTMARENEMKMAMKETKAKKTNAKKILSMMPRRSEATPLGQTQIIYRRSLNVMCFFLFGNR